VAILNNVEHGDLRYAPVYGSQYGDTVNRMQLCIGEFAEAQRHHPIIFAPDGNGQLMPMALLGFERGENLHFGGSDWGSSYIPAARRRGPFSLTVKTGPDGSALDMLVEVDLDDSRVGSADGAPLFKTHGGNSPMLDMISEALVTLYDGVRSNPAFIEALNAHGLLREVQMDIDLGDGRSFSIAGHHVVDGQAFAELGGAALQSLNEAGYLQPVVHALSSLANIQNLVDRKVALASDAG
jgi:SapC